MAQDYMKINDTVIRQPDEGLGYSFETTYSEDTNRTQSGRLVASPMFTVEAFFYKASFLTKAEVKTILQLVAKGKPFDLYCFSPYYGAWRTDKFYVGKGDLEIGRLNAKTELFDSLSFNMIGVTPI